MFEIHISLFLSIFSEQTRYQGKLLAIKLVAAGQTDHSFGRIRGSMCECKLCRKGTPAVPIRTCLMSTAREMFFSRSSLPAQTRPFNEN